MDKQFEFYDATALLERLTGGLKDRIQNVVFLVGSPISAPIATGGLGVPNVTGVVKLIRDVFLHQPQQLEAFDQIQRQPNLNPYQSAFSFLLGRRGPRTVNEVVRKAVILARAKRETSDSFLTSDEVCRYLDSDVFGWQLTPAVEALGQLITGYPDRFGKVVLTTNFDPLIEVSVQRSGGTYYRTNLHADGNLSQTQGMGCHVVHFHGYWHGSDTLHTPRQLGQPRPKLHDSLSSLIRDALVVVCAYSGWDDSFTEALMKVVRDDTAYPEVLWTFLDSNPIPNEPLIGHLSPGVHRGRVGLYAGIDCNIFLPALLKAWRFEGPPLISSPQLIYARLDDKVVKEYTDTAESAGVRRGLLEGDDEDRPPHVGICVGRDLELEAIKRSPARSIFITGIGGQGKSTVAAQSFADAQIPPAQYGLFVWRDCKEESERFENQLASIVEKLSAGKVSGADLAKQDAFSIVELVIRFLRHQKVLLVFDNIDHYVNIETRRMTRSVNIFVEALLSNDVQSRAIFTCRPSIEYDHELAFSCYLEGLDLTAATQLFLRRGAACAESDIIRAHTLTNGHAFWLDLLAAQVVRPDKPITLARLVSQMATNIGFIPESALNSFWITLTDRDRTVLRAMAETVRPETHIQIADYVRGHLNFNQTSKAIRTLRALNLVVVKPRLDGDDLLELHPIVRTFVRGTFSHSERLSFIDPIRTAYRQWITQYRSSLQLHPKLSTLQHWTQNAELDIEAGNVVEALKTLAEVSGAFSGSAYPREFCRAAEVVFAKVKWTEDYSGVNGFDILVDTYVNTLSYLGEYHQAQRVLDDYAVNVPDKDVRYIRYCGMRCQAYWIEGDLAEAVKWGRIGQSLKDQSDVDTDYDIANQLALAERDAGRPEVALPVFLAGRSVEEVTDPSELDDQRGGPHYGNVGRCLQYMGQLKAALVCYQKSALIVEKAARGAHVGNQAFIRTWIGEILAATGDFRIAAVFFCAARTKWEQVAPPRVSTILVLEEELHDRLDGWRVDEDKAEAICLDWIRGKRIQV